MKYPKDVTEIQENFSYMYNIKNSCQATSFYQYKFWVFLLTGEEIGSDVVSVVPQPHFMATGNSGRDRYEVAHTTGKAHEPPSPCQPPATAFNLCHLFLGSSPLYALHYGRLVSPLRICEMYFWSPCH